MASSTQTYTTTVILNTAQAKSQIEQLTRKVEDLRKKREAALAAGDTKGIKAYANELKKTEKELQTLETRTQSVDRVLGNISTANLKDLKTTIKAINKELNSGAVARGSQEWKELQAQLARCKAELQAIRQESAAAAASGSSGFFGKLKTGFSSVTGQLAVIAGAWGAAAATVKSTVEAYARLDDAMANVRKYTGLSKEEMVELNEAFKQMDTRTSIEGLNELAAAAGRLGITSKDQILEFVEAADLINVALGDDLGEGAIDQIGKLASMFGETDRLGLRQALLSTGSAVNKLSATSSAQAGYMVEFATALSGIAVQAGLTQEQILGFASALNQNGQEAATSSTVFSQLITKMFQDPAKWAQLAGVEVQAFTDLLKNDCNAALMQFLTTMQDKGGFDAMAPMFEEMGLNGTRAVGVLSSVASHLDQVAEAQKIATDAYKEATSVGEEANTMNETAAAKLEKTEKRISSLAQKVGEALYPVVDKLLTAFERMYPLLDAIGTVFSKVTGYVAKFVGKIAPAIQALKAFNLLLKAYNKLTGKDGGEGKKDETPKMEITVPNDNHHQQNKPAKTTGNGGGGTKTGTGVGGTKTNTTTKKDTAKEQADKELKELKRRYDLELAYETDRYNQGIVDQEQYLQTTHQNRQDLYADELAALVQYGQQQGDAYQQISLQLQQEQTASDNKLRDLSLKDLEQRHQAEQALIKASAYDPASELYGDEQALNDALLQSDVKYLREKQSRYKQSSQEWANIEGEIETRLNADKLQKAKDYQQQWEALRKQYQQTTAAERMQEEMDTLEKLHAAGYSSEEEYQRMLQALRFKYAGEAADESTAAKQGGTDALELAQKNVGASSASTAAASAGDASGAVTGLASIFSQVAAQEQVNEELERLYEENVITKEQYDEAMRQNSAQTWASIQASATAALQGINSILSSVSAYTQACSDLETAKIEANYEKQIEAAGNNSKKVKKLEEKRDKEIKAAKTAANKKAMKIEIAQAIASTAMAAINAYTSAAQVPYVGYILGPIAAAAATAAGLLQIATIKKQHQAEAAGYYVGGFTGGRRYKQQAGVVHEGEFVANHEAVNNASVLPALQLIDQAQRDNTVSRLTSDDIARSVGGGNVTVAAPNVNVTTDNSELRQTLYDTAQAVDSLQAIITNGITAKVQLDGTDGLDAQYRRYKRLKQ